MSSRSGQTHSKKSSSVTVPQTEKMGNCTCHDVSHLAAVARDFCPFPDYRPSPLISILSENPSLKLSEHYAAVQTSLTPPQQQDFTRTLRSTFGREGTVSNGGVGVVALSLAVLFDTVARQVKGEYEPYEEPIPGLFLRDPRGTYPPQVHIISKYLRLVPHIANNPTRMRDETEKYLLELKQTAAFAMNDDITTMIDLDCYWIKLSMETHLRRIANNTKALDTIPSKGGNFTTKEAVYTLNCDHKEASERFSAELDSARRTKEAFQRCDEKRKTAVEHIVMFDLVFQTLQCHRFIDKSLLAPAGDFDLKTNALGKWIL